jgi:heat-inducible transcriptional repressor
MVEERRLAVLRAIVEDYVATEEPVGSKALVERHNLGVSPATIRNDMAALEEEGYITQPHTSAGRVPTDKGYRLFVDRLSTVMRLLAQLTRQVAVVQYPSLTRSTVRHVELVPLSEVRTLLVVITDTGRVEQRVVDGRGRVGEKLLGDLRARLNAAVVGRRLTEVPDLVADLTERFAPEDRPLVTAVVTVLIETVLDQPEERVVLAGTANLARRLGPDVQVALRPVLEALEEQVVLLRLLGEATDPSTVTVRIGHEIPHASLAATSMVSTGYGAGHEAVAKLGVLGPTRMDYPTTMGAVRAVARYVGHILAES